MNKRFSMFMVSVSTVALLFPTLANAATDATPQPNPVLAKSLHTLQKISNDKDFVIVENRGNGNYSFTSAPGVDKHTFLSKLQQYSSQTDSYPLSSVNSIAAYDGTVTARFNDTEKIEEAGAAYDDQVWFSGNSNSFYSGSNPYYASKITDADTFAFDYWGPGGASMSWNGGSINVSSGGNSATINYPVLSGNYYDYYHSYNNVYGTAYEITYITRTLQTTYLFGNQTFSTAAVNGLNIHS